MDRIKFNLPTIAYNIKAMKTDSRDIIFIDDNNNLSFYIHLDYFSDNYNIHFVNANGSGRVEYKKYLEDLLIRYNIQLAVVFSMGYNTRKFLLDNKFN